jgi:hypothetical protein
MRLRYLHSAPALIHSLIMLLCLAVLSHSACASEAKVREIRYPGFVESDVIYSKRTRYYATLLELALSHSEHEFSLTPVKVPTITGSRNTRYLDNGLYDINWMHTTRDREQALIPIRIPLLKGLIGWRIFFIHPEQQTRFENVNTADELKPFIAGLGHDWPDTQILNINGFNTSTTTGRNSLLKMLSHQRIDYYPRSLMEIWEEIEVFDTRGALVDENIALHYPSAVYFFVPKRDPDLAELIQSGLEASIADGSFDEAFYEYFGEYIARANLEKRAVISIPNPIMSEETPLARKELWFQPEHFKAQ